MRNKFKFYKQVKTLYIDENEGIVDSFINNDDFVFRTRKGGFWFTCEELNKKYKNFILIQLYGHKWLKNGEGNTLEEDETFYYEDAFQEIEPSEKQLAKAEKRFKCFLEQQFQNYSDEYLKEREKEINEIKTYKINRLEEYQNYFECDLELVLRMIKDGCYFKDFETGIIKRCLNVDYDFKNKEFTCHYGNGMTCYSYEDYGREIAYDREELEK